MKKHTADYGDSAKQYPNRGMNISGATGGAAKVSTVKTTEENPNNGLKPNAGKAPKHQHSSY